MNRDLFGVFLDAYIGIAELDLDLGIGTIIQCLSLIHISCCPRMVVNLSLPDEPVITGTSAEVSEYYGLTGQGIARRVQELLRQL